MLGDTAVAVNPDDDAYTDLVGKHVILPLVGRRIPIVADEYSDPEKGSGAVKVTPAHDFNDFEVGRRHNLPQISVLDRRAVSPLSATKITCAACRTSRSSSRRNSTASTALPRASRSSRGWKISGSWSGPNRIRTWYRMAIAPASSSSPI
jgi:hypothetical protein